MGSRHQLSVDQLGKSKVRRENIVRHDLMETIKKSEESKWTTIARNMSCCSSQTEEEVGDDDDDEDDDT